MGEGGGAEGVEVQVMGKGHSYVYIPDSTEFGPGLN